MKAGRKSDTHTKMRYKAIAEIIANHGTMSSRKIAEILKKDYGIAVSHATVNEDLKKDLEALTADDLRNKKGHILETVEELAEQAYNIAMTDENNKTRLSAMDTYARLMKTNAEVIKKFEEVKLKMTEADRPIYNIFIGKPREADLSKIKDMRDEKDE